MNSTFREEFIEYGVDELGEHVLCTSKTVIERA